MAKSFFIASIAVFFISLISAFIWMNKSPDWENQANENEVNPEDLLDDESDAVLEDFDDDSNLDSKVDSTGGAPESTRQMRVAAETAAPPEADAFSGNEAHFDQSGPNAFVLQDDQKRTIFDCLKGIKPSFQEQDMAATRDLDTLLISIDHRHGPPSSWLVSRRMQVRTRKGEGMQLSYSSLMTGPRFEFGLLHLNSAEVSSKPLPKSLKTLPADTTFSRFSKWGDVIYDRVEETRRWPSKASASIVREGGKTTWTTLSFDRARLSCGKPSDGPGWDCSCDVP